METDLWIRTLFPLLPCLNNHLLTLPDVSGGRLDGPGLQVGNHWTWSS